MKIALETSSIMPLLEVTPRTSPLQQNSWFLTSNATI